MSFALGLTGSIGMGKSTTARIFADKGCAVWDADAAVHRLYARGGAAIAPMKARFPSAVSENGVDRAVLKELISQDGQVLRQIEEIVHPLVFQDRAAFRAQTQADIVVFDVPLLFEVGGAEEMDAIACVHVDAETQKQRVLARGTMTEAQFSQILHKQMPIAEKIALSDYVIETDTLAHAEAQVTQVLKDIQQRIANA